MRESSSWILVLQENEYEKIDGCLTWLHRHSNSGGRPITFHVRFLEDLAGELYSHEGKNIAEASITEMLTTTGFDYVPNTRFVRTVLLAGKNNLFHVLLLVVGVDYCKSGNLCHLFSSCKNLFSEAV
jgi:hypothetical protein